MRMAVGSVKMQPPCESPALAAVAAVAAADGALRRSPSAREPEREQLPVAPRPRLRDLPALLRSGLTLRRKRSAAGGRLTPALLVLMLFRRIWPCQIVYLQLLGGVHAVIYPEGLVAGHPEKTSHRGEDLKSTRKAMVSSWMEAALTWRSCVGSELVDWLLEHCPFVPCRSMAIGVWQLLLDMGILSSVDQHLYFQDTCAFYQFSSDECSYLYCEFEREEEWQNGVRLLLQLVPLVPSRAGVCELSHQKIEDSEESSDEILARLTSAITFGRYICSISCCLCHEIEEISTVQRELAAVIALKARKSALAQDEENSDKHVTVTEAEAAADPQSYRFVDDIISCILRIRLEPTDRSKDSVQTGIYGSLAQAGMMCKLQERDDIGRIELVQKLARESCQFLQADKKEQEKSEHQDDEVSTVEVKEQDQKVLVLKKVQSCGPAPQAGSAESDWRYVVVSGTPEKILEHLLNDLHLEEVQDKETVPFASLLIANMESVLFLLIAVEVLEDF
ncbi:hypothetical protein JEQ12_015401, partial [Ovis aries]